VSVTLASSPAVEVLSEARAEQLIRMPYVGSTSVRATSTVIGPQHPWPAPAVSAAEFDQPEGLTDRRQQIGTGLQGGRPQSGSARALLFDTTPNLKRRADQRGRRSRLT
jgi:hypothetical protein